LRLSTAPKKQEHRIMEKPLKRFFTALILACAISGTYHVFKPMPTGLNFTAPLRYTNDVEFLIDSTYVDANGQPAQGHEIFDEILRLINQAEKLVVVDMFLFNGFAAEPHHRPLSRQITRALIKRRHAVPALDAVLITDPLNTLYGGLEAAHLEQLRKAGVNVVMTDLSQLRDSNPTWSGFWRLCCQWLGNDPDGGWLPNALGPGDVTLRSYLALLNFKANHRKTLVVDEGDNWAGLVTSANPHDASSAHSNTALRFRGPAALDLLLTEVSVIRMSGRATPFPVPAMPTPAASGLQLQILTEAAIRDAALIAIRNTRADDQIQLAQFYLTHRGLIEAMIAAHDRGVSVRVILDPNKDAFGREKSGLPNRQVAMELNQAGVSVRWCATHGEQCHSKLLLVSGAARKAELIMGSANYTRRNLDNYNLETNARLLAPDNAEAIAEARALFERRWNNTDGRLYSLDYEKFADESALRYWQYRVMEFTGWSTF
jgi:hypothetical protein